MRYYAKSVLTYIANACKRQTKKGKKKMTNTITKLNQARLKKHLKTVFRFNIGVMTLQEFLNTAGLEYKGTTVRHYASKRINLEYRRLVTPKTEYWVGRDSTLWPVSKLVYDYVDLPLREESIAAKSN
jgi:hypothetical protein